MLKKKFLLPCSLAFALGLASCVELPSESIPSSLPSDSVVPSDSTGGSPIDPSSSETPLSKYEVSHSYWNTNITKGALLTRLHNLTFHLRGTDDMGNAVSGSLANDYGKYHVEYNDANENTNFFAESLGDGSFDFYSQEDGAWTKMNLSSEHVSMITGTFSSFLPSLDYDKFAYNATTHAYEASGIKIGGNAVASSASVRFEDEKLLSITLVGTATSETGATYEYNGAISVSDWGTTTVTLPTIEDKPVTVSVESVILSQEKIALQVGGEPIQLRATVLPENATDKTITWTSSDKSVATVENGLVTAVGAGTASIMASAGGCYAYCTVTVTEESAPTTNDNPFYGVTLSYAYAGYGDERITPYGTYDIGWLDQKMTTVTVSFFADGIVAGGNAYAASFELVSKEATGKINYAYFGKYSTDVEENYVSMSVTSFYSGTTGRYYHNDNIGRRLDKEYAFSINGGFSFYKKTAQDDYVMDSYFLCPDNGTGNNPHIAFKGPFTFKKEAVAPTHVDGLPEDSGVDEVLEPLVEGKVFEFKEGSCADQTIDLTPYSSLLVSSSISIFEDNELEYQIRKAKVGDKTIDCDMVYVGTYEIDRTEPSDPLYGESTLLIKFTPYSVYLDGEAVPGGTSEVFTFIFNEKTNVLVHHSEIEKGVYADFSYELKSGVAPAHYVPALADNWDEAALLAAFESIGIKETLPKLANVKVFSIGEVDVDKASFTVTCVMASKTYGASHAITYVSTLTGDHGFVMKWTEDRQSIYYTSPKGQFELYTNQVTSDDKVTTLTLTVKKHQIVYPSAAIAEFMESCGYEDPIIEFKTDAATDYLFSSGALLISLDPDDKQLNVDGIIASFGEQLVGKGYKKKTYNGLTYYIAPSKDFSFCMVPTIKESSASITVVFASGDIPSEEFPADEVNAYLKGVTDPTFAFSSEEATSYELSAPVLYDPFPTLYLHLPVGASGVEIAAGFKASLEKLGYTHYDSVTAIKNPGADSQEEQNFKDVYVSPNRQVAYEVFGAVANPDYRGYVSIKIVNLTEFSKVTCSGDAPEIAVTEVQFLNYTQKWNVGDKFYYDGSVLLTLNDGTTQEGTTDYLNYDQPDMSEPGEKEITITFIDPYGQTQTGTITITVVVPVTVSKVEFVDYTEEYTVGDKFSFDGTILITYSDDSTAEGDLKDLHYTAPNMNAPGEKTISLSYAPADGGFYKGTITITVVAPVTISSVQFVDYTGEYTVGDEYSFDGTILITYSDGSTEEGSLNSLRYQAPDMSVAGEKSISLSYAAEDGKTYTGNITITVVAPVTISKVEFVEYTDEYTVGDEYSFDGTIVITYSDGTTDYGDLENLSYQAPNMSVAGEKTIALSYTAEDEKVYSGSITITVAAEEPVDPEPELISYEYINASQNDWIMNNDPLFKVWAWGGEYGGGRWVDVTVEYSEAYNGYVFSFSLYDNCDGFKFVRMDPTVELPPEAFPQDMTKVWNQSQNLVPGQSMSEGVDYKTFTF